MVRFNSDDQFKFLISCIRWSNNGRIDFSEVAKECGICTKGAAAKRYERMMKAHSIGPEPPYNNKSESPEASTPQKDAGKKDTAKSPKQNKRKIGDNDDNNQPRGRKASKTNKSKKVKEEANEDVSSSEIELSNAEDVDIKSEDPIDVHAEYTQTLQSFGLNPSLADDGLLTSETGFDGAADYEISPFMDPMTLQQAAQNNANFATTSSFPLYDGAWEQPEVSHMGPSDSNESFGLTR